VQFGVRKFFPKTSRTPQLFTFISAKGITRTATTRGISLLSIAGKILAQILFNRLLEHLEHGLLKERQCGFRAGRGTTDIIFAARQLQEIYQEQHQNLYTI
jgi:hypothetical protein